MESRFFKEDLPNSSVSASSGIEQKKISTGVSITKSVGYLPAVEKKLEASSKLASDNLTALITKTASNMCETAVRHGKEIGFKPKPEICEPVHEVISTLNETKIVEESTNALEQVGAQ
jgi:hypothetical protein